MFWRCNFDRMARKPEFLSPEWTVWFVLELDLFPIPFERASLITTEKPTLR